MKFPRTPIVARPASAAWNVTKTLAQTAVMWATFFGFLPALVAAIEDRFVPSARFDPGVWSLVAAWTFWIAGGIAVATGLFLAVAGEGTPLPLDTARRLVLRGLYRWIRNPMATLSILQGACIGVWRGSGLTILYAIAGGFVWHCVARPWEEKDLAARFGDAYERYRRAVRCWIPRLRPYDATRG